MVGKFLDSLGPGWPIAARFSSVAYHLLIDPCAWCQWGGSSRLAAGYAHTLRAGGERELPATAASLALAGRGSRLWLSAFADNGRPPPSLFAYRRGDRTYAMAVEQTERSGAQSQHARGLTIQLSQGQGRQPLRPEGAPPAAGVPHSHAACAFDGEEEAAG